MAINVLLVSSSYQLHLVRGVGISVYWWLVALALARGAICKTLKKCFLARQFYETIQRLILSKINCLASVFRLSTPLSLATGNGRWNPNLIKGLAIAEPFVPQQSRFCCASFST